MDEDEAESIRRKHTAALMRLPGVCGVSDLRRDENGNPVLVLFLDETAEPARLPKAIEGLTLGYEYTGSVKAT